MYGQVVAALTGLIEDEDFFMCADSDDNFYIEYLVGGDFPTYDEVLAQMESDVSLIEPYKKPAIDAINGVVDEITRQVITVIFKQMGTYLAKEQEALSYEDGVSTAETHPYIFAEVAGLSGAGFITTLKGFPLTPAGMAQEYLTNATLWRGLDAAIEAIRPVAAELIRAATTTDYIEAVSNTATTTIMNLVTCTTQKEIQAVLAGVTWPAKP
jgi:hypothetical protein